MTRFSPSDAAIEGFHVLRDHWRAVVGWAVFNLIALIAVIVAAAVIAAGLVAAAGSEASNAAPVAAALGGFLGVVGPEVVIAAALLRLLLRPEEPAFIYLRLGLDELRLAAVMLIWMVAAMVLSGAAGALAGALEAVSGWAALGVAAASAALLVWLSLRFSLVAPLTFARRRIDFLGSWRLTHGRTASLFGVAVLVGCLAALLLLAVALVLFLVGGFTTGFGDMFAGLSDAERLQAHPGLFVLEFAVQLLLLPVVLVIVLTPYVAAFRALTADI